MSTQNEKQKQPNKPAQNASTRLAATQLIYEHYLTEDSYKALLSDYYKRADNPIDEEGEEALIAPNLTLLKEIIEPLETHQPMFEEIIANTLKNKEKKPELLIQSAVLAAVSELFTASDRGVDTPIIINDYLEVTRAFFDEKEVKLVNGMINACQKAL